MPAPRLTGKLEAHLLIKQNLGVRLGRWPVVRRLIKFDLPPTNAVVMLYAASPTLRFVAADLLFLLNSSAALAESGGVG